MKANVIDLYTSLVAADAQLPASSDAHRDIKSGISLLQNLPMKQNDYGDDIAEEYYKGICFAIYENIRLIQDRVDDLDKISPGIGDKRGISHSKKVNVVLLGETSSGKTTFLSRMFGETCGATGAIPITAFTVIHKITRKSSYLEIAFKEQFHIEREEKEPFVIFLKKYGLFDRFDIIQNTFTPKGEFEMEDKDEFINFVYEANKFPFAFENITWHHKLSPKKQLEFLEFANIYDMPGTGGQQEHNENIANSIKKYGNDIDLVLYLIKPDKGVSSSYSILKELKEQFDTLGKYPELYFVYQKYNNSIFDELVDNLRIFITKDSDSDANDPFDANQKEFFLNSYVLDARGKEDDKIHANIALATLLQQFYLRKASKYCDSIKLSKTPMEYDIAMNSGKMNIRNVNSMLFDFLEEKSCERAENGGLPQISDVIQSFKKQFNISSFAPPESCTPDLESTLKGLYDDIQRQLEDLFDYLTRHTVIDKVTKVTDFISIKKGTNSENRFPSTDKDVLGKFDKSKYEENFYSEYMRQKDWQKLMYNIQAYHWLRLNYDKRSVRISAQACADPLKEYLNEYINRLKLIENKLPVILSLDNLQ